MHPQVTLVHITTVPESLLFLRGKLGFLHKRGLTVHAISSPGDRLQKFAQQEPAQIHAIPMERRITPFRDLLALWRLYRVIRAIRPQIVHAHTPKAGLLGSLAAWLARVPVRIHTINGLPLMTAHGLKRLLLRWSEIISCRCVCQINVVSHSIADIAVQEGLCPATKIKVFLNGSSNGVDAMGRFNPKHYGIKIRRIIRQKHQIPHDAVVMGFVGRIVRDKGMTELAEAWSVLREEFPALHLLLVGSFEPQDPVPKEVKALFHSDPRIHLVGQVEETSLYYAAIDVCVLPTYREGLPGVCLEAAAMQVPVVATCIPGCIDIVEDNVTGLLVSPRDARALAEALRKYLKSPSLRQRHGQAGRERVRRDFQPEMIWEALYQDYISLLKEKGLPLPTAAHYPATIHVAERRAA